MNEPVAQNADRLSLAAERRVDEICIRFESALQVGQLAKIEDYLDATAEPERSALLRELIRLEVEYRIRRGERPNLEEYRSRFPTHASSMASWYPSEPTIGFSPAADRNLLFGILALQMDFISRDDLIAAMNRWVLEKQTPLGQLLLQQKALTSDTHALLEALVQKHLALNHINAKQGHLAARSPHDADGDAHGATISVGALTSTGQRFRVLRPHAKGGLGEVFVAHDEELHREVALKEIQGRHALNKASRLRFVLEAEITGGLEHPGIVPVYGVGQHQDGRPYYAMRFIRGRTLSLAVKEFHQKRVAGQDASLDVSMLLHAFVVVCNTIGFAHSRGVIHRDLKGENVILGNFGEVVVLDWGLAKVVGTPDHIDNASLGSLAERLGDSDLSVSGQLMGTPAYMAPEQAARQHDRVDRCTDIYGLGAILYEILTGRPPFADPDLAELLHKIQEEQPTPPRLHWPEVAPGLEAICLRALAKKPEDRYRTAKELGEAVQQWQEAERRQAEEALRASEERYRMLVDVIPQNVWTAGPDGKLDYANKRAAEYHGATQFQGDDWQRYVHPDDLPRCIAGWIKSLQSGEIGEHEFRLLAADGSYRWYLSRAVPMRDDAGNIVKWFGTNTDIHDRKLVEDELSRTEKALRDSEAQFRLLADAIPQLVWSKRPDGSNEYLNERWFQYSGQSSEASLSTRWGWAEILHPDDLLRTQELWDRAMQTGEGFEIEYRLRRQSDGAYRWHLGRALPVRDHSGRIIRWFGTCTDIEDQKRVEEKLRASEERYRLLADVIPQNVWTARPDGALDYVNQRSSIYHGSPQYTGDVWQQFVHPDDVPRCQAVWADCLRSGESYQVEFRLRADDGNYRWHLSRAVPVRNEVGEIVKWFGTNTDIEDQKRIEDELRKSRERFDLAAKGSEAGLWDWDLTTDEVYYSPQYKAIIGYENHEFSIRREEWAKWVHPEDYDRVVNEVLVHLKGRDSHGSCEYRLRHKDGSYRWIRSRSFALRDATGQVYRISGSHQDITDQMTTKEALRISEERYRLLADAIPQIVWATNPDGANEYLNRRWFEYTGFTPEQSSGYGWMDVVHAEDKARALDAWARAREKNERFEVEYRLRRADGVYRWHLVLAIPLRNAHGYIVAWSGTCTEIDDRKTTNK